MERPKSFTWKGDAAQNGTAYSPAAAGETPAAPPVEPPAVPPEKPPGRKKRRPAAGRFRIRLRYVLPAVLVVLLLGAGAAWWWIQSLDIGKLVIPPAAPATLLDKNGHKASVLAAAKYDPVPLSQIPEHLRHAVVAVEDRRFYDHSGVDVPGILRAAFRNAKSGGAAEGGSTITQQLAKNVFLNGEKTFRRKLAEAAYAIKIETTYDKDRILELYLNQIYFGEGQWGIRNAALRYFGKEVRDLDLAESALLAALPKAPSRYSPFRNRELALERRNLVLSMMLQQGYITQREYEQARSEPIRLTEKRSDTERQIGRYGSFADAVMDEAIDRYGFTERELLAGGFRIYTTLDPDVQNAMESSFAKDDLFPAGAKDQIVQAGAVMLDPHTGGVRGIVGQRGEHAFRGFNRAVQLQRQPGSTFKPLAVYAPALMKGYGADSALYDGPLDIGGYDPGNADGQYRGQVSLHDALVQSRNIPAVWLLNEIGIDAGMDFAKKAGIPLTPEDRNLSLALGGLSRGVSPLQMAQAFGVFPALGKLTPAHTIIKITTADGKVLAEAPNETVQVMPQEKAYEMTALLQDVVRQGTGTKAAVPGRPTAGKTGTTQLPDTAAFKDAEGGTKDVWFVGYTPELTCAVWMGYDRTDGSHYLTTSGGQYPAMLFRDMMTAALKDRPVSAFKRPAEAGKPAKEDKREKNGKPAKEEKPKKEEKPGKGKGEKPQKKKEKGPKEGKHKKKE